MMPDPLPLPELPVLHGERVALRGPRDSDVDDRLLYPITEEEEDNYGSAWRRGWDGQQHHTREGLTARRTAAQPGHYDWAVEYDGHCIGSASLEVDADQHRAEYSVGLWVPALRGQGLGKEITRLILAWGFGSLGLHRIELQVLAGNQRGIGCYLACGFQQEGVRREAEVYPDGWKDFVLMSLLRHEYQPSRG